MHRVSDVSGPTDAAASPPYDDVTEELIQRGRVLDIPLAEPTSSRTDAGQDPGVDCGIYD